MAGILEKMGEVVDNAPPQIGDGKGSEVMPNPMPLDVLSSHT
jgi:hypothetical protein